MISIQFSAARAFLPAALLPTILAVILAAMLAVPVAAPASVQQGDTGSSKSAPKAHHTFTNDDMGSGDTRASGSGPSDDELPSIPGLIKCGKDVDCFLQALDKNTPASVTRVESLEAGGVTLSSNSVWWTTRIDADRVVLSLRLYAFDAKVDENAAIPQAARDTIEAKMAEVSRNFESIRGKTGTCFLATKDLKALMKSSWTLMSLGSASSFGKSCSGPAFEDDKGALPSGLK